KFVVSLRMMKHDWKKIAMKTLDWLANIVIAVFCLGVLYILIQIFVCVSFTIPSDSMYPAIEPGDRVWVDKWLTGARLFDIFDAAEGKAVDIRRTPQLRRYKNGDVLVFNFPYRGSWDTIAMDYRVYYIKRCMGIPGDTLEIRDFRYFVNGKEAEKGPKRHSIAPYYPPDSVARASTAGYLAFAKDSIDRWTVRDMGPLYIPSRGGTVELTPANCLRYKQLIEWETHDTLRIDSLGRATIGGVRADRYTFRENYYFMAGDKSYNSKDSRYWGLCPEPFIVGRAVMIWWSEDRNGRLRWRRMLRRLQ
ncbi:MAG: signal peptidase I, partial [Muribaculaceae bacterium]|nr:signal peptidase I [Muribaculaceae bacterium]